MTRAFADTFFFLAVLNRRDTAHEKALAIYSESIYRMVTTQWVLTEVGDAMSTPQLRPFIISLMAELRTDPHVHIVAASDDSFEMGFRLFQNRKDKSWSLTDCISMA